MITSILEADPALLRTDDRPTILATTPSRAIRPVWFMS